MTYRGPGSPAVMGSNASVRPVTLRHPPFDELCLFREIRFDMQLSIAYMY